MHPCLSRTRYWIAAIASWCLEVSLFPLRMNLPTQTKEKLQTFVGLLFSLLPAVCSHQPAGGQENMKCTCGTRYLTLKFSEWMCVIGQLMSTLMRRSLLWLLPGRAHNICSCEWELIQPESVKDRELPKYIFDLSVPHKHWLYFSHLLCHIFSTFQAVWWWWTCYSRWTLGSRTSQAMKFPMRHWKR